MDQALHDAALDYHEFPSRGKISVTPTRKLATQRDLSLVATLPIADMDAYRARLASMMADA